MGRFNGGVVNRDESERNGVRVRGQRHGGGTGQVRAAGVGHSHGNGLAGHGVAGHGSRDGLTLENLGGGQGQQQSRQVRVHHQDLRGSTEETGGFR